MLALFVFASLAVADPGTPWNKKIAGAERFKVLSQFGDEAVFDKETGRVWEKSPGDTDGDGDVDANDRRNWVGALLHCYQKEVGGRQGWRLPTIEELASLVDLSQPQPRLPAGHPFSNVQHSQYWSATTYADGTSDAYLVFFTNGFVSYGNKTSNSLFVWCVRGGQGIDGQ
jgi:hypothetical protein